MQRDVLPLRNLPSDRSGAFGGKARSLAKLIRKGFSVPDGVAIAASLSTRFAEGVLPPEDRIERLLDAVAPEAARLLSIVQTLETAELLEEIEAPLRIAYEMVRPMAPSGMAVRSSSTVEDEQDASAAGVLVTVLGVEDFEAFARAVKRCWASAYAPRSIAYLRAQPRKRTPSIGVVVQGMVRSEVSGVAFTRHPLTGDDAEVVIESTYGLGAGVVEGSGATDLVRIDKRTRALRDQVIGEKRSMTVLGADGVRTVDVIDELRHAPSLDAARAVEVAELAMRLEKELSFPVDLEFAFANEKLHLLQARPITVARRGLSRAHKRSSADRSRFVWSNINVGESLPGVATPFTWSVLSAFSELGFRRAFGALGCTVPDDAELVGEFRGRIYLNMSEFMRVLSQVPFMDPRIIVALGGGDFASRIEMPEVREGRASFIARLPITATRFLAESATLDARIETFGRAFDEERARLASIDLRLLSAQALDRTLLDVEHLLDELGAVMLTAYGSLLASVVLLDGWLRLLVGSEADKLERDLITGLAAVESAAPGLALGRLAASALQDAPAATYLRSTEPALLSLDAMPDGPTRQGLVTLIRRYGHRGFREAEIAEPRWGEDPRILLRTIRDYVLAGDSVGQLAQRQRRIAEARLGAERRLTTLVPLPLRPLARALVKRVQRLVAMREKLRSDTISVLGAYRTVVLEVSRRIVSRDPSVGPDAGFFLTLDEVHAYLEGRLGRIAETVAGRRARHRRDARLAEPPSTFVGHPPDEAGPAPAGADLHGLPASSGIAEGVVRVLRTAADTERLERGAILVVPSADVGWSPLFLLASAVVTDLGGPLSHAAIVMRELGVPAVVNVTDATRTLRDGERVFVDGDAGLVRRLDLAVGEGGEPR